jgi:hypothetical protein
MALVLNLNEPPKNSYASCILSVMYKLSSSAKEIEVAMKIRQQLVYKYPHPASKQLVLQPFFLEHNIV